MTSTARSIDRFEADETEAAGPALGLATSLAFSASFWALLAVIATEFGR